MVNVESAFWDKFAVVMEYLAAFGELALCYDSGALHRCWIRERDLALSVNPDLKLLLNVAGASAHCLDRSVSAKARRVLRSRFVSDARRSALQTDYALSEPASSDPIEQDSP